MPSLKDQSVGNEVGDFPFWAVCSLEFSLDILRVLTNVTHPKHSQSSFDTSHSCHAANRELAFLGYNMRGLMKSVYLFDNDRLAIFKKQ